MNTKEINSTTWVRKSTIITSFALGWILTIVGFFMPPRGVVDNSVLVILGQALTYTACGIGLKSYADISITKLEEIKRQNTEQ